MLNTTNGRPEKEVGFTTVNTNNTVDEIVNLIRPLEEAVLDIPKSDLRFLLPRILNKIRDALAANPSPNKAVELQGLYAEVQGKLGKLRPEE